ncbi:MAG: hypothetical protein ACT4OX_01715 [Actinomycetota bacterium]
MTDKVEKFVNEFEAAIDAVARNTSSKRSVDLARRHATQLAASLEGLAAAGLTTAAVTSDDLEALDAELTAVREAPQLDPMIEKAKALVTVVEDGLVDADATRLRAALKRSEELTRTSGRVRGEGQPRLAKAVRARCSSCDDIIVGRRREGALNWNALTKSIRDHERDHHGGYSEDLRDDLRRARGRLDAGDSPVEAGRYELRQA